jgi:hypothetical protein
MLVPFTFLKIINGNRSMDLHLEIVIAMKQFGFIIKVIKKKDLKFHE